MRFSHIHRNKKDMKRLAITLLIVMMMCQAHIYADKYEYGGPTWGVKAMLDINVPGKWKVNGESMKMYRKGLGGSVGAVCNLYLTDNIFIEPGASLYYDTFASTGFVISDEEPSEKAEPSAYKIGLRIPVVIGYTFDITDNFSLNIYTGPELSYSFGGGYRIKQSQKDLIDGLSLFGNDGNKGELRRFDLGWKGGIGFPFDNWMISFEAAVGLTDVINGPISMKDNRINIGLTRYF